MPEVKRGRPKATPTRLIITIGGFAGAHYEVRLQRGRLQYRTDDSQETVAPSVRDWEIFWTEMSRINVWSWNAQYVDPEILDGTQWTIDISDGSRRIHCTGSNAYPGGHDRESARPFQEFLAAVGALVRRPFGYEA